MYLEGLSWTCGHLVLVCPVYQKQAKQPNEHLLAQILASVLHPAALLPSADSAMRCINEHCIASTQGSLQNGPVSESSTLLRNAGHIMKLSQQEEHISRWCKTSCRTCTSVVFLRCHQTAWRMQALLQTDYGSVSRSRGLHPQLISVYTWAFMPITCIQ